MKSGVVSQRQARHRPPLRRSQFSIVSQERLQGGSQIDLADPCVSLRRRDPQAPPL